MGFAYNLTTNQCEKRLIGSFCSSNSHCLLRSLNSVCDKKRSECECAWGTRYETKLDTCVPDTSTNSLNNNGVGVGGGNSNFGPNNKQIYYMSKCEQDSECSLTGGLPSSISTTNQQHPSSISSGIGISSTISSTLSPSSIITSTISSQSTSSVSSSFSSTSSSLINNQLANSNSIQSTAIINENNNYNSMLEQADQENPFGNQIRYLHGHRRLKESLRRANGNYHLRELQCIRGRCMCSSLHSWDGHLHCKVPFDLNQSNSNSTHRHNRKNNHNTFGDLDDELTDNFEEDNGLITGQTIFLMVLGTSLFAGFIFK